MSLQPPNFPLPANRLSLVSELPSPQPETNEGSKRLSRYTEDDDSEHISARGSRRGSDAEMLVPIRRRSLLQHGIATRPNFMADDPRSALPSQMRLPHEMQNYYYNPEKPTESPLSALEMLGPNTAFAVPGPRTETPTDLGHTGAYKLGSLRITNGPASPAPSIDERSSSLGAEEKYEEARKSVKKAHHKGLSKRSNTLSVPTEASKTPWIVNSSSPLRQAYATEFVQLTIDIPSPTFELFDFNTTERLTKDSPTRSADLAHEYQQEIASSPFSFENSPLPSPKLESTSKHTAMEDHLFEAEMCTPTIENTPRFQSSFDSGYEGGPIRKVKGPREQPPKPLAKADSGYSSNMSLRSFKKESSPAVPPKDSPPTLIRDSFTRVPSSSYSVNSTITLGSETMVTQERIVVAATPAKAFNTAAELPSPPVPRKSREQAEAANLSKPHLEVPAPKASRRKSLPAIAKVAQEMRESSPADSEKSTSTASSSIWQRKKLNKRPQSYQPPVAQPVYTVQAFRTPSEQFRIPVPPVEARQHLDQRVAGFPIASIPNTFSRSSRLRHSSSKETLGTIFSVGSLEIKDELNFARLQGKLPAVPPPETIPEAPVDSAPPAAPRAPRPDYNKRHTFQAVPAAPGLRQEQSRQPFQPPRRDHVHGSKEKVQTQMGYSNPAPAFRATGQLDPHFVSQLTSFDNISSSLGKSPYELAVGTLPQQKKPVSERAKSMTAQFEADAAACYARARTVSQESQSTIVRTKKSYDSISSSSNPYATETISVQRVSSRGSRGPPQAHANMRRSQYFQQARSIESMQQTYSQQEYVQDKQAVETEDDSQRLSIRTLKTKVAPPVSMTTQRKALPTVPSYTAPALRQISNETPPPLPTPSAPRHQTSDDAINDGWKKSAGAWAARRQTAGEALVTKKSIEIAVPVASELKARKSMDANAYRESMRNGQQPQALRSPKSFEAPQSKQGRSWNVGVGYENSSYGQQTQSQPRYQQQGYQIEEYTHTYGATDSYYDKENLSYTNQYSEQEYYEPEAESEHREAQRLPETIHQRKTSTSEMLVLDRFSGGLDYGYEPGLGLVGSAGTRNVGKMANAGRKSVRESMHYGVDFSDVPVILQRVRVES